MFADPLTAKRDTPTTTDNYTLWDVVSRQSGSDATRKITTHSAGNPSELRISHSQTGKGALLRDRRLAKISCFQVVDGVEVKDGTLPPYTLSLIADFPRVAISDALTTLLFEQFTGMIRANSVNDTVSTVRSGFIDPFLNGES